VSDVERSDPLRELVVDAQSIDRERIVAALRGRVGLDQSSSQPVVMPAFMELGTDGKILAFLLARKAAVLMDLATEEAVTPTTLANGTGMPGGTVRRALRELVDAHRISQASDRSYHLSSPQVGLAVDSLSSAAAGEGKPSKPAKKSSRRASKATGRNVPAGLVNGASPKGSTGKRQAGPASMIAGLIESGYLDTPRSLSEVQRRLKDKAGRQIPVTTLSPQFTRLLRSGALDRERSDAGVYEYVARNQETETSTP
jgi:hypothetical protein